jgi:YHS domain-containing protein
MKYSAALLVCMVAGTVFAAEAPAKRTSKEALRAFNDLVGSWRCTGTPEGKKKEFWTESMEWEWQFKGDEAWMKVAFEKGKYFAGGELRFLPDKEQFQLTLQTVDKEKLTFGGSLKEKTLTLDREDESAKETQRLVFTFLHPNRFLYRYETKAADGRAFAKLYQVGATKNGVPFAEGETGPECIVSGGLGAIKVTYKGQTYYVCCSGCRDAFKDDPEKYLKEAEARKKGK